MMQSWRKELEAEEEMSGCTTTDNLVQEALVEVHSSELLGGRAVEEPVTQGVLLGPAVWARRIDLVARRVQPMRGPDALRQEGLDDRQCLPVLTAALVKMKG
jgi:hypothetical protein